MKKSPYILLILFLTALFPVAVSCNGGKIDVEEVETFSDVSVNVQLKGVVSSFVPYYDTDLSMLGSVQVVSYLYNAEGQRVDQSSTKVSDFSASTDFRFTLGSKAGSCTLVTLAYCTDATVSGVSPAYSVTGADYLSTLTVTQNSEYANYSSWGAIGYDVRKISSTSGAVSINLKPAASMVYLFWQDIHAHDNSFNSEDIYGDYSATAWDYWGSNTYTWTITLEKGSAQNEVIVKNLCPYLVQLGYTDSMGVNIFSGTYDAAAGTLTIPRGQSTGLSYDGKAICLEGGTSDGDYIIYEDVVLTVLDGILVTNNMFGTCIPGGDSGWWDLFWPGVVFCKETGWAVVDEYYIVYHNNDVMTFSESGPAFTTSLGQVNNRGCSIQPSDFPEYRNIYDMVFLFPGSFSIFSRTIWSDDSLTDSPKVEASVSADKQYVFTMDCSNHTISARQGTLTKAGSADFFVRPSHVCLPSIRHTDAPFTLEPIDR